MTPLPRVHDILNLLYPKGWEDQDALQEGTDCHRLTAEVLSAIKQGKCPLITDEHVKKERVLRLLEWYQTQALEPVELEWTVTSEKYGYYGTVDFYALRKTRPLIIDWKFAAVITEANLMQLEAYKHLLPGANAAIVQIPKQGPVRYRLVPSRPYLWATFLAGVSVWKWRQHHGHPNITDDQ